MSKVKSINNKAQKIYYFLQKRILFLFLFIFISGFILFQDLIDKLVKTISILIIAVFLLLITKLSQRILSFCDRQRYLLFKNTTTKLKNPNLPLDTMEQDKLNFKPLVDKITLFIKEGILENEISKPENQTIYNHGRIMIEGEWGSGKTTLINFVKEELKKDKQIEIIEFNIWNFHNFDQVLEAVIKDLSKKFSYHYYDGLLHTLRVHMKFEIFNFNIEFDNDLMFTEKLEDFQNHIAKRLHKDSKKLVIIFDDIDRVPDEKIIINVIKIINLILRIPNVFIIEAIDEDNLSKVLKDRQRVVGYYFKSADLIIRLEPKNMGNFMREKIFEFIIPIKNNNIKDESSFQEFDKKMENLEILDDLEDFSFLQNLKTWIEIKTLFSILFNLDIFTPRHANLLIENALNKIKANEIVKDILLTDILLMEYLNLFHHQVWRYILKKWWLFVDQEDFDAFDRNKIFRITGVIHFKDSYKKELEKILKEWQENFYKDREKEFSIVKVVVDILFGKSINIKTRSTNEDSESIFSIWGDFGYYEIENSDDIIGKLMYLLVNPFRLRRLENFLEYFDFGYEQKVLFSNDYYLYSMKEIREKIKDKKESFINDVMLSSVKSSIRKDKTLPTYEKIWLALWDNEELKNWFKEQSGSFFTENLNIKSKLKNLIKELGEGKRKKIIANFHL